MASIQLKYAESYDVIKKARYIEFVGSLGADVRFDYDTWLCTNLRRYPYEDNHKLAVYFSAIPPEYRELVKYFAAIRFLNGITIGTVKSNITSLAVFASFLVEIDIFRLCDASIHTATLFKRYLDEHDSVEVSKSTIWSAVGLLFCVMQDFDGVKLKNHFSHNPYDSHKNHDYKFIPDDVAEQLDKAFMDSVIPLEYRTAYWILRLIPSRISEVLSMKTDCLRPYGNSYVLFIPTWKQNGGRKEPIMRSVHIQNEGMGAHLILLIMEQGRIAESLQEFMLEDKKGALFTYQRKVVRKNGAVYPAQDFRTLTWSGLRYQLGKISDRYNILDENGKVYYVTTHQFRHNGITDRLAAGFTVEQIADMTGHHGDAMIWGAYAHLDLKPKEITEKQRYVLKEDFENPYVLFGGRILHMEEQLEKRLLKNIRAHQVRGGICGDVTGCKSDMWNCLACKSFIPDRVQLAYFEEQTETWAEKAVKFSVFPIIRKNAERNAELFRRITEKIKLEDLCNE